MYSRQCFHSCKSCPPHPTKPPTQHTHPPTHTGQCKAFSLSYHTSYTYIPPTISLLPFSLFYLLLPPSVFISANLPSTSVFLKRARRRSSICKYWPIIHTAFLVTYVTSKDSTVMGFCVLSTISHKQALADLWKKEGAKSIYLTYTVHQLLL